MITHRNLARIKHNFIDIFLDKNNGKLILGWLIFSICNILTERQFHFLQLPVNQM